MCPPFLGAYSWIKVKPSSLPEKKLLITRVEKG